MTLPEHFLSCICGSSEHQLIFGYDDEMMWTEVYLATPGFAPARPISEWLCDNLPGFLIQFLARIKPATKYLFGYRCRYGHWDCVLLDRAKAKALRDFIDEFLGADSD